jgi:hypothetical protein
MITTPTALHSLQLLIKCLAASVDMLFWSVGLLAFFQCVAGMIISNLAQDYINDEHADLDTFSRAILTMFEVLFANWSPACRVLVENVSEWFSLVFLLTTSVL